MTDGREVNSFFNATVQTKTYMTPYVLFGDYILYLAFTTLLVAALWLLDWGAGNAKKVSSTR